MVAIFNWMLNNIILDYVFFMLYKDQIFISIIILKALYIAKLKCVAAKHINKEHYYNF